MLASARLLDKAHEMKAKKDVKASLARSLEYLKKILFKVLQPYQKALELG